MPGAVCRFWRGPSCRLQVQNSGCSCELVALEVTLDFRFFREARLQAIQSKNCSQCDSCILRWILRLRLTARTVN